MAGSLLRVYNGTVLRFPRMTLLVVFVFAAGMAIGLQNFRIDASADSLTLEHDADLDYFRELTQRYGSTDLLVVTYRPKGVDLFSDASLQTLEAMTSQLSAVPGIVNVQSIINVPLLF